MFTTNRPARVQQLDVLSLGPWCTCVPTAFVLCAMTGNRQASLSQPQPLCCPHVLEVCLVLYGSLGVQPVVPHPTEAAANCSDHLTPSGYHGNVWRFFSFFFFMVWLGSFHFAVTGRRGERAESTEPFVKKHF